MRRSAATFMATVRLCRQRPELWVGVVSPAKTGFASAALLAASLVSASPLLLIGLIGQFPRRPAEKPIWFREIFSLTCLMALFAMAFYFASFALARSFITSRGRRSPGDPGFRRAIVEHSTAWCVFSSVVGALLSLTPIGLSLRYPPERDTTGMWMPNMVMAAALPITLVFGPCVGAVLMLRQTRGALRANHVANTPGSERQPARESPPAAEGGA